MGDQEVLEELVVGPYGARHICTDEELAHLVGELDVGPYGARHIYVVEAYGYLMELKLTLRKVLTFRLFLRTFVALLGTCRKRLRLPCLHFTDRLRSARSSTFFTVRYSETQELHMRESWSCSSYYFRL